MKQQDIIKLWRDIEVFDLPEMNREATLLGESEMYPWQFQRHTRSPKHSWQYTLIFGRIKKELVIAHIDDLLGTKDVRQNWEEPVSGFTFLSAIILDHQGRPDDKSYVPASFLFGLEMLKKTGSVDGLEKRLETEREDFVLRNNINIDSSQDFEQSEESAKGNSFTASQLSAEKVYLKDITSDWLQAEIEIYVVAKEIFQGSRPDPELMNSFYLKDLDALSKTIPENYSGPLREYLKQQESVPLRKDVIADRRHLFDAVDPRQMGYGRWPSSIKYGLYTAQNGAVNRVFSKLGDSTGIQGVNGPPGTGKTTLLKDVIAEIVVRRAMVLMDIGCFGLFGGGFEKVTRPWGFSLSYHLNSKLIDDFGIVIASSNNNAVENISKELPDREELDTEEFSDADYFSECTKGLLKKESWGALSAALGKLENKLAFRSIFWDGKGGQVDAKGFEELLKDAAETSEDGYFADKFEQTRNKLRDAIAKFDSFKKKASDFHQSIKEYGRNKEKKDQLKELLDNLDRIKKMLLEKKSVNQAKIVESKDELDRIKVAKDLRAVSRPSFYIFHRLFSTKAYKRYKSSAEQLLHEYTICLARYRDHQKEGGDIDENIVISNSDINKSSAELFMVQKAINKHLDDEEDMSKTYGIAVKDLYNSDFNSLSMEEIHIRSPYHSGQIAHLRSSIFLLSLDLHRYAILANAKKVHHSLRLYFDMLTGRAEVSQGISRNLWSIFFLCVPSVSTTFASASRLFPSIERGQIGWLLVDEAGQATPQSLAGCLQRAKRSVIIGDPLQVEPVVTIPERLVHKLSHNLDVDAIWSPVYTSAQQLADRVSEHGSYMGNGASAAGSIWTGFPLRSHRRCENPMFDIANMIAYGGQMVKAANQKTDHEYLGPSCWFDISDKAAPVYKHVLRGEVELLSEKISELRNTSFEGIIYVISPFKSVAAYCRDTFSGSPGVSCGTIHQFQGKEAEVVFLILGGDPSSVGARRWASSRPNMLNVALTRAKNRFYVIGNRALWGSCSNFDVMARKLTFVSSEAVG